MQKCSFEDGCSDRVTYACRCTSPFIYLCDSHLIDHTRTPGEHLTECVIVKLSRNQTRELLPKVKDLIKYLKKHRNTIMNNSKILIECIEKETRKSLYHIKELKQASIDLISERSISKESYEIIQCISVENLHIVSNEVENIKNSIEWLCESYKTYNYQETWKECTQVIFSRDAAGGLLSIDLNTFKLSNLDYAPKIGLYSHACKIDQNTYFFHGGRTNSGYRAEAYLINIKDKNYETLKNGPTKDFGGGSALKDNKVYIFGGWNGSVLSTCDTFDLKTREWKSITALPQASHQITAAILGKDIILSGNQLNCCYSYNDSTFTNILNLPINIFKIVCEGWIYTNSILYENQYQISSKWTFHNVTSWTNHLWTYCVFKKNQFLYFIDCSNNLMRIDTSLKKLEKITYT